MFNLELDMIATLFFGLLSLGLGSNLKKRTKAFDRFGIPAAVIGGLIFAIIHLILKESNILSIKYTTTLQDPFMLVFFTIIGLASSVEGLKKGGKLLIIFWLASGFMTLMQTVLGVTFAKLLNINPLFGVLAGSVSMSGGHGSAGAFGKSIESMGVVGALPLALSAATFGLIAGGLLGSPLANHLIKKYSLKPIGEMSFNREKNEKKEEVKTSLSIILNHILVLSGLITTGIYFSKFISSTFDLALPTYVGSMICAIIFNNINNKMKWIDLNRGFLDSLSDVSLNIFLSMALISLKLWELYALALPMLIILLIQVAFMFIYTRYVVFYLLGKNYDAAVMIAGMCGSGLGATSNAMINMEEVSAKYGYTPVPYLIVPLTGAFLIDIFQMPVILTAINLFK